LNLGITGAGGSEVEVELVGVELVGVELVGVELGVVVTGEGVGLGVGVAVADACPTGLPPAAAMAIAENNEAIQAAEICEAPVTPTIAAL